MAPPSIRRAKRPTDDPILQRVKYLYSAAKAYEESLPTLAAHLGRQTLKIASDAPKALSRECLQSLCPKCGYPWESSDKERFTMKPLTSGRQAKMGTAGRPGSAKPNAVRLSGCRLCGWTKTTRVHVDELQVEKDEDAGLSAQRRAGADSDTDRTPEFFSAGPPGSNSRAVPESSRHAEQVQATGTADEGPHAPVAGDTGQTDGDCQAASTRPDANMGNAPFTETLAPSPPPCGAHDNPSRADEQPQVSKDRTEAFGMYHQMLAADKTGYSEGHDEARPATAAAFPLSAPEACAVDCTDQACAANDKLPRTETLADGSNGGEYEITGTQGGIRSQIRHMMDASLPIASAMREAVKQFESSENETVAMAKWPHKGRKRKHKSDVQKYSWLRVGRTWRKRAKVKL